MNKIVVGLVIVLSSLAAKADWGVNMKVDHLRCIGEAKEPEKTDMKYVEIVVNNLGEENKGMISFRSEVMGPVVDSMTMTPPSTTNVGSEGVVYTQYEMANGQGFRVNMGDNDQNEMAKAGLEGEVSKVMKFAGSVDMWKWKGAEVRQWYTLSCHLKLSKDVPAHGFVLE